MTPEKKARIEELAKVVFEARQKKDSLGAHNLYGRSHEENLRTEQEFQVAHAEYMEACTNLDQAQRAEVGATDEAALAERSATLAQFTPQDVTFAKLLLGQLEGRAWPTAEPNWNIIEVWARDLTRRMANGPERKSP